MSTPDISVIDQDWQEEEEGTSNSSAAEKALLGETHYQDTSSHRKLFYFHWVVHLCCGIILVSTWASSSNRDCQSAQDVIYLPSPALVAFGHTFSSMKTNATTPQDYMGPPTSKNMKAWEQISSTGLINVTREEMIALNKSLDSAQYPLEQGGGYMGSLEASHNLHCLYSLWKSYYIAKDPSIRIPDPEEKFEKDWNTFDDKHFNHCVNMLRQELLCHPTPGIVTYNWVNGYPSPRPNFNTVRMCPNANLQAMGTLTGKEYWQDGGTSFEAYDALLQWNNVRRIQSAVGHDLFHWEMPADAVVYDSLP